MKIHVLLLAASLGLAGSTWADGNTSVATYVSAQGRTLRAEFIDQPPTVRVTLSGHKPVLLHGANAASGVRYTRGKREFWQHQDEASYSRGAKILFVGTQKNR